MTDQSVTKVDPDIVVTDILDGPGGPIAFRQAVPRVGNRPGRYRLVCPWCAVDLGQTKAFDYGTLYNKLVIRQRAHMEHCPNQEAVAMKVRRPDGTLGFLQSRYGPREETDKSD